MANPITATLRGELEELFRVLDGAPTNWFPTFSDFCQHPNTSGIVQQLKKTAGYDEATLSIFAQQLYTVLVIRNAGTPVFELRPTLVNLLSNTDLPCDIPVSQLVLPFEGLMLRFPIGTLESHPRCHELHVVHVPGDRLRVLARMLMDTPEGLANMVSYASLDMVLSLAAGDSIGAAVERIRSSDLGRPLLGEGAMPITDYYADPFFLLAINTILYISSEGADVVQDRAGVYRIHQKLQGLKKGRRRAELEEKLAHEKARKIYICGATLRPAPELTATMTREGHELTKRFRVRGHWRNQAHGVGRSERRLTWIQPHWKGPTYAELLERNYVVRAPEKQSPAPHRS